MYSRLKRELVIVINRKKKYKLIRLMVTLGLIFSQLVLPIRRLGLQMISTQTKVIPQEIVTQTETQGTQVVATKQKLESENSSLKVALKRESGFEHNATIDASLDTESQEDNSQRSVTQAIVTMALELRKQGLSIVDTKIVRIQSSTNQRNDITTTLTFKNGLSLEGASTEANDPNVRVGIVNPNDTVQTITPAIKQEADGKVKNLVFTGRLGKQVIIVSTTHLKEEQTISLDSYGELVIDGAVGLSQKDRPPYSKPITVNILKPKLSSIESSLDSKDFEIVKTIDNLYTWDDQFYLLDFISKQYEVLKTDYQSAKDSTPQIRDILFGEYTVEPLVMNKGHNNTINIYIRSTRPLGLKPIGAAPALIQPRSFRSLTPRSTRMKRSAPVEKFEGELEHHKRIDYLGDNQNNPDTTIDDKENEHDTSDLYRLYLDMTGKKNPLDILVVVDKSGSMQEGIGSVQRYRYYAQRWDDYYSRWVYHGTFDYPSYQGESFNRDQIHYRYRGIVSVSDGIRRDDAVKNSLLGVNGLLQRFVNINPENKLSVIGFQGSADYHAGKWYPDQSPRGGFYQPNLNNSRDAELLKGWSTNSLLDPNTLTALHNNGTNYHAALLKAKEILNEVKDDGRRKIMIFISDGVPTFYFGEDGYRSGNGSSNDRNNVTRSQEGSKLAIDEFKAIYPNLSIYSLGVSKDINSDTASSSPVVLKYLSGEEHYYGITDTAELEKTLNKIVEDSKLSQLEISDSLSQYVDYYDKQPDVLVTRKSKVNDETEILYQKDQVQGAGKDIIDKVVFTPKTTSQPKGKVTLTFKSDYKVDDEYTYTLSFNVKASDEAYEKYKDNEGRYSEMGDSDTDYGTNQTSSGKGGLPSNSDASVNYMADGREQKLPYKHPVIQVKTVPITFTKVDADNNQKKLAGVEFELRKEDKKIVWEKGTTGSNGQLNFKYLQKGKTYYLYETKAKLGYTLPENPWEVAVANNGDIKVKHPIEGELKSKDGSYMIKNYKIYQLPSSGGRGSQIFIIVGSMTATVALLFYRRQHRKKQY
ncbi:TPA: FCT-1 pilus minor subunit FctX [Streptococcus pyogenes]|nr:VWA domain-containing protein [Streptococcus pyogenes]